MSSGAGPGGRFTPAALTAVLERLCAPLGLAHRDARLVKFTSNAVFDLPGDRVVVRIVGSMALRHRAEKVVRVARWLAAHDVPAVRLVEEFPQPLAVGGHLATIWHTVPSDGPPVDGRDLGELLRRIHALPEPPFRLPRWSPLDDVRKRIADAEELSDPDRAFLEERLALLESRVADLATALPEGVLHGDAHLGNLIPSPDGPVICDFDSTSVGPREWDLSTLPVGVARFGHPAAWYRQLAGVYGFDVTRWPGFPVLRDVRELKLTTSVLPILRSHPDVRGELRRRLAALRAGDTATPWTPYR
ncbi:aminoglycoside phosphotransferase family protein [Saccharothrix australiensis]|uniref:Aminoglycoside phosphotransferase (APT) family kinase protein n=1 Tax=Saccharothrix australiensis TaxID=2072 RepID=A0A495VT65_9PSEU|nr:aminoglycoside phosphotransferase family protein [Saccharothrix australiensis]RKT51887.1 aminoglycoside phosphotransferase (APT) family kinase protein [Saccharothrix australiensis]